jgi:hypothetical protein
MSASSELGAYQGTSLARWAARAFSLAGVLPILEKGIVVFRRSCLFAAAAALILAFGVVAAGALSASAATTACGLNCVSVFSKELGSFNQPSLVEDVLDGVPTIGQPLILKQASSSDTSEDTVANVMQVSAFYAAGMVSAEAGTHYRGLLAAQIQYAPNGVRTGLCVGLATVAYQDEGLTLQPCSVPGVTVWILDSMHSSDPVNYSAIVNASTTDFDHPFAMDLPRDEVVSAHQLLQIRVRHLQFLGSDKLLPDRQLWGVHHGPFS